MVDVPITCGQSVGPAKVSQPPHDALHYVANSRRKGLSNCGFLDFIRRLSGGSKRRTNSFAPQLQSPLVLQQCPIHVCSERSHPRQKCTKTRIFPIRRVGEMMQYSLDSPRLKGFPARLRTLALPPRMGTWLRDWSWPSYLKKFQKMNDGSTGRIAVEPFFASGVQVRVETCTRQILPA